MDAERGSAGAQGYRDTKPGTRTADAWDEDWMRYFHGPSFPSRTPDLIAICIREHAPSALWWTLSQLDPARVFASREELLEELKRPEKAPRPPRPPMQF